MNWPVGLLFGGVSSLACGLAVGWIPIGVGDAPGAALAQPVRVFRDPAPPVENQLPPMDPPGATPHPRVTVHAQPKPLPTGAVTHDWVSFLGPQHNATSSETKLLKRWPPEGPKLVWELRKGESYSSPAIQRDRLVFTHRIADEVIVECLHPETGNRYWQFTYPTHFVDRFGYNNGPRSSPVIDGDRVYVYSAEGRLYCLKLDTGQVYWQRDLAREFQVSQDFFGTSTSPLVEGDLLIINLGAPGGPCVAAFDKRTGKLVWGAGDEWGPSYASPVPARVHGQRRVLVFAGGESKPPTGGLLSINPATGAVDFAFPWRSHEFESVNASNPVVVDDQVFISANYKQGSAAVRMAPDFTHELLWVNQDLGTHWNTAIYKDGYFYGFDGHFEDDASFLCVDARTGKTMWRALPVWEEKLMINGMERRVQTGICRGSLLLVDGSCLCLGEFGHLLWLDLNPHGYQELERTWLFAARETWALPVLSRGLLYISQNGRGIVDRSPPRLLCYDLRAEEP
jgi:outer membrane protein assembly factor BamB